jgi:alginate O-acetyltransferase complex protein AlgI
MPPRIILLWTFAMAFNSFSYLLFVTIVYLAYYFSKDSFRWFVLFVASMAFYSALRAPHLIVILLTITTISYFIGLWIDQSTSLKAKKYLLISGISANALTLISLKYLPFITHNINIMIRFTASFVLSLQDKPKMVFFVLTPVNTAIVSIGVSYYIFQAISYLIDIYWETEKPERHFGHFALYMSFFPKLLQGPIERAGDLLPQFKRPYIFDYDNARSGMLFFAWGLFKKMVIADRLALLVDPVYNNIHDHNGFQFIIATYCYALQIYFDFSGYTDMAIGTAKLFNINLTQNFNRPYLATSVADFWRRWHISFSRWILDYIFKPVQMSLRYWGQWGATIALMVTFLISGIWHGANWGFIVWGLLHGFYMASAAIFRPFHKKLFNRLNINTKSTFYRTLQVFFVFNLVSFAWIFFRANSISDAAYIVTSIQTHLFNSDFIHNFMYPYPGLEIISGNALILVAALLLATFNSQIFTVQKYSSFYRWSFYLALVSSTLFLGVYDDVKFIYNRF